MKKQKITLRELKVEMKRLKGAGINAEDIDEQVDELCRKLPGIKQHLEKYRGQQLQQQWAQRSRFSPQAVDDLCDKLFNGE